MAVIAQLEKDWLLAKEPRAVAGAEAVEEGVVVVVAAEIGVRRMQSVTTVGGGTKRIRLQSEKEGKLSGGR